MNPDDNLPMDFDDALEKLGISDYRDKIINSNSRGGLVHFMDYIIIASSIDDCSWFREWFEALVKLAEKHWKRPESIYQHILSYLTDKNQ